MEAVAVVVLGKLVLYTVDSDLALVDTVGVTTDGCTEISLVVLREIILDSAESVDDIFEFAVTVRNHDCDQSAAVVCDAHFKAVLIYQGKEVSLFSLDSRLKIFAFQSR